MMWSPKNTKKAKQWETPIADFLLSNREELTASFHALPIFTMKPGTRGYEKYKKLFGSQSFSLETTVTGRIFDSFFYPTRCIKKSQDYASQLFGSKDTLFVTCGTTISNQIVVDALVSEDSRVLLDREAHQSMHFAVKSRIKKLDYFYSESYCSATAKKYIKIDDMLSQIKKAVEDNKPYDVLIFNASSYDGVICNVYQVIKRVNAISPNTKFIVDEAWSSAIYFHPELYPFTASFAAKKLNYSVDIVSTQSAHKSLMALRQASLIHSFACDEITEKLYKSRFKFHSTSPSYAILASIDLARAQMQSCGTAMLTEAMSCADYLREKIKSDELLSVYLHKNDRESISVLSEGVSFEDPLKVHLNIEKIGFSGQELQEYLYQHYGLYFNRFTEKTILINMHIGVKKEDIDCLIEALKTVLFERKSKGISSIKQHDFIISYPPGIPMHAPGEFLDNNIHANIQNSVKNGISVFQIS